MHSSQKGITLQDYNYLKCWVALIKQGKSVFQQIFLWGYVGGKSLGDIKEKLFELQPSYSNAQYRREFNSLQRERIENGCLQDFDLTLLYDLLQRVCRLPPTSSGFWGKGDSDTLPGILYQIKMKRNHFAHPKLDVTSEMMTSEVEGLRDLFLEAIEKAGQEYNIDNQEVKIIQDKLKTHMNAIKNSHLGELKTSRIIVAKEKHSMALKQARIELFEMYKSFLKVLLPPVHSSGKKCHQSVSDIFVEPLLKKMPADALFQQITDSDSVVRIEDLLALKMADGSFPQVILLLSQSGMGKTTLAKYFIYDWLESNAKVKGLEEYDLVFYLDCRNFNASSLSEFLAETLPQTSKLLENSDLKFLILTVKVLFILDNFDELNSNANKSIEELMRLNSAQIKIIATSKQRLSSIKSNQLHIKLHGIAPPDLITCLSRINQSYGRESDSASLKLFCEEYLSKLSFLNSEFIHSPQTICHIFFHWLMKSKDNQTVVCTTETELFMTSHQLLLEKMANASGGLKTSISVLERHRTRTQLREFFTHVFRTAFNHLEHSPFIKSEHIRQFEEWLDRKRLPYHFIIPEIFSLDEFIGPNMEVGLKVSFPSVSIQLFYSGLYLTDLFTENSELKLEKLLNESTKDLRKSNSLIQLMKYVLGLAVLNDIKNLEERIEEIFELVHEICAPTTDVWLDLIEEAHCNKFALKAANKFIKLPWKVNDRRISPVLLQMLRVYPPKELTLTCSENPAEIYGLKSVLKECGEVSGLELSLHLYYHFWVEKVTASDEYLTLLDLKNINLLQFSGRLSSDGLNMLPACIQRLALHISPTDIPTLNRCLKTLTNLKLLYINLNIDFGYSIQDLQRIKVPKRETIFCIDLWNLDGSHVEWGCNVAAILAPCYCRLTLRKTKFTCEEAKNWLEGLRERRIHVDTAVIGSTNEITEREHLRLKELGQSFQCFEVKWLKIS